MIHPRLPNGSGVGRFWAAAAGPTLVGAAAHLRQRGTVGEISDCFPDVKLLQVRDVGVRQASQEGRHIGVHRWRGREMSGRTFPPQDPERLGRVDPRPVQKAITRSGSGSLAHSPRTHRLIETSAQGTPWP